MPLFTKGDKHMNENEIKIAESFNILDKCQKLEKDFYGLVE